MQGSQRAHRMVELDTLRALAIVAVLVEHWSGPAISRNIPIGAGTMGVGLFFVLSGFLITGTLLRDASDGTRGRGSILESFYIRRVFRLAPAYYAVIAALTLLNVRDIGDSWPWHAAYLSNVYVALGGRSNVFWTLAVEEQFYLLWPLILLWVPGRHVLRASLGLIAADLALRCAFTAAGFAPEFRLTCFQLIPLGAGCALSAFLSNGRKGLDFSRVTPRAERLFTIVALGALALAVLVWSVSGGAAGGRIRFLLNDPLTVPFYCWAVFQAARGVRGPLAPLMQNPALRFVGQISYGIYLVHSFVPTVIAMTFGTLSRPVAAVLSVVVTFGLCALSWAIYERPLIALSRRIVARRTERRGPVETAGASL